MKGDFTRLTFRKEKHYSSVRRQQGRVDLDADWNEQADIMAYRNETEARDVIGPSGAPKHDAGFGVNIAGAPNGDFKIGKGRFYVDGILCENETEILFTKQPDLPGINKLTAKGGYVVYLDVWQRHLTALDDPEIREVALGGPDTATRTKTIWQVRTAAVGANITCASKPAPWKAASTGRLSARVQPDAQSDKPCIVPPGAGYRRLENQLYRVEIHGAGDLSSGPPPTFKWSRDNGSIAARIASITNNQITLTTSRKDSALGFAPGQWIEIIDAGQDLRGEPGALVQITAVDDLVLTVDQATVIGTFPSSSSNQALFPKVRRWDSAGVVTVTVPSTNDGFIALEDGVEVKFESGSYNTGDYWMIPARTDRGTVEWPLDESTSPPVPVPQPPMGIQHHFCRLAIIEVGNNGKITFKEDCRSLFPPLTELEDCCGCCTKTVGKTGAADYPSIQKAVDSLPASGGQICVLDGTYAESVVIDGKQNIIITGCRDRSVLTPGLTAAGVEIGPIIQIKNCTNIRLELLSFVQAQSCAVVVLNSHQVTICECEFIMTKPNASEPAIFFQGDEGLIERNEIIGREVTAPPSPEVETESPQTMATGRATVPSSSVFQSTAQPASGIQLAGGCYRVRVLDNLISRVGGQGITLGSLEEAASPASPATSTESQTASSARTIIGRFINPDDPCADCGGVTNEAPTPPSDRPTHEIVSPESLSDINIERNRIRSTGLDGIGVIAFFDLSKNDEFVSVRRLTILGNEITDCLSVAPKPITPAMVDSMGYGGIALGDVSELVIHDNAIEYNGTHHDQPVCGIFVLHGEGIDIERNRILGNGYQPGELIFQLGAAAAPLAGRQAGIHIVYAVAPVATTMSLGMVNPAGVIQWSSGKGEPTGFPALKLHDNIVSAPKGRALSVVALGPVSVVGNQLTSGRLVTSERPSVFAPATVFIFNLGMSNEIYGQQISFAQIGTQQAAAAPGLDDSRPGDRLANGNVLFADNQCSLDLLESGTNMLYASLTLASLDDIGFLNNQSDCNLPRPSQERTMNILGAHVFLFGPSLRMIGNRLKEGLLNAAYSAMTTGFLNITAHNQTTHCLMVNGLMTQDGPNFVVASGNCGRNFETTLNNLVATRSQQP
jgi:uncharacterized protein DUF6519